MDQIKSTRDMAEEITDDLKNKMVQHAQLIGEFEKNNRCISRLVMLMATFPIPPPIRIQYWLRAIY